VHYNEERDVMENKAIANKENDLETSPEKEILGDGDVATVAHEKEKYVMGNKTLKQKESTEKRRLNKDDDVIHVDNDERNSGDRENKVAVGDFYKELNSLIIILNNQQEEIKEKEASKNALSYKCQDKEREIYSLRSDLDRSANEIEDLKIKLTGGEAEIKRLDVLTREAEQESRGKDLDMQGLVNQIRHLEGKIARIQRPGCCGWLKSRSSQD